MVKNKLWLIATMIICLVWANIAFAEEVSELPPLPSIYYGSVTDQNGQPIASGKIIALIDNDSKGEVDFQNGTYEKLLVQALSDSVGKPVTFMVLINGKEYTAVSNPAEILWASGKVSGWDIPNVNLTVNVTEEPAPQEPPATPTANPGPGTYTGSISIALSCTTNGAKIYYTTDGSDPLDSQGKVEYIANIALNTDTTIKAVSEINGVYSDVATFEYTFAQEGAPAPPSANPSTGTYSTARNVILSCSTAGAKIYYTLDETDPKTSQSRVEYTSAINISETKTIKAVSEKDGLYSALRSFSYTIGTEEILTQHVQVSVIPSSVTLKVGDRRQLTASTTPASTTKTYSSNKTSVATVSQSGLVTAIAEGEATITVTASKSGYESDYATVKVYVTEKDVVKVTVSPTDLQLKAGETKQLTVTTDPAGAVKKFSSSNTGVATVGSAGLVKGIGKGTATITVTATKSGYETGTDEILVTVTGEAAPINQGGASQGALPADIAQHWAFNVIKSLYDKGIIGGYPDGTFKPDNNISRAEFAAILTKAMGLAPQSPPAPTYNDVAPGSWYYGSVEAAAKAGLVKGYEDGCFSPDVRITRQEMATVLVLAMKMESAALAGAGQKTNFRDDGNISAWARGFVITAFQQGLVSGNTDNTFKPGNNATRAEASAMIFRFLEKTK